MIRSWFAQLRLFLNVTNLNIFTFAFSVSYHTSILIKYYFHIGEGILDFFVCLEKVLAPMGGSFFHL